MSSLNAKSFARCLEKTELLRSGLQWRNTLDKAGIQKVLRQVLSLREDLLYISKIDRYKKKAEQLREKEVIPYKARKEQLLERNFVFEGIFGENPKLLKVLETLERAAATELPVMIGGESGTGKELLAKVVHANSNRADASFISVNCGAIPDTLLESELFGHVKGSFTGAIRDRQGKFELADGGTLFLDEIGELSLENQVKLLRVLQSGEIQRIGRDETIRVNTRIVTATNRDLLDMMQKGTFREDLYYRISVISVLTPPLRERRDELPLLIDYFCREASEKLNRQPIQITTRLNKFLHEYSYPGNIRELQNIIYRISCLADQTADLSDLPVHILKGLTRFYEEESRENTTDDARSIEDVRKAAVDQAEIQFLEKKLSQTKGNVTLIAEQLDMNRSYLQKMLKKHGIRSKEFKAKKG